jgi:hypothetical protein
MSDMEEMERSLVEKLKDTQRKHIVANQSLE